MKHQTVKKTHEDAIQAVADFAIKSIRYWHVLKTEKQRTARFRVAMRCRFPWITILFCFQLSDIEVPRGFFIPVYSQQMLIKQQ